MKLRIARWGNSLAVRLPKSLARDAGLEEGDEVAADVTSDGTVSLRPRPHRQSLAELVKRITPANRHREIDWGRPVGREPR